MVGPRFSGMAIKATHFE